MNTKKWGKYTASLYDYDGDKKAFEAFEPDELSTPWIACDSKNGLNVVWPMTQFVWEIVDNEPVYHCRFMDVGINLVDLLINYAESFSEDDREHLNYLVSLLTDAINFINEPKD